MPAEYGVRIRMGTLCVLLAQLFGGSEAVRIDLHVLTAEHEKDGVGVGFHPKRLLCWNPDLLLAFGDDLRRLSPRCRV